MTIRRRSSLDQQHGFYPFFGVNQPFDPEETFVTARFLSPKVFGGLRLLFGVYALTTVIVDIVLTGILPHFSSLPTPISFTIRNLLDYRGLIFLCSNDRRHRFVL